MLLLLESVGEFDSLADFNPETGTVAIFSRRANPGRVGTRDVAGYLAYLGGKRAILFRLQGELWLDFDGTRLPMKNHFVVLHPMARGTALRVLTAGQIVFELIYHRVRPGPPIDHLWHPFLEEEDFDFGVLLANISKDEARQTRMFHGLRDRNSSPPGFRNTKSARR